MEKPAELIDREQQWQSLVRFLKQGGSALRIGLLSGRRRYGKSFLLRTLCEQTGGLYVTAVQEEGKTAAQNRFTSAIARYAGLPAESLQLDDWERIFAVALDVLNRNFTGAGFPLLVIDEVPYLLDHSPQISSLIQHLYDDSQLGRAPGGRLILCGSAMSVMNELLSGTQALRGRATVDMRLPAFDYRESATLWGITDPSIAFRLYAILGGAPGYRNLVLTDPPTTLEEFNNWVVETFFNIDFGLFTRNETDHLLREDPRITNRTSYYEVLNAVANGASTPSKIGSLIGRERTSLHHILEVLASADYLQREADILQQRKTTITIADPIIRFDQLVTVPRIESLERRQGNQVWAAVQQTFQAQILGPQFEQIARDWTRRYASTETRQELQIGQVGSTQVHDGTGRAKYEIDVLALAPGQRPQTAGLHINVLGEAKATAVQRSPADLNRLEQLRQVLANQGHHTTEAALVLFSLNGFTPTLQELATKRNDVILVGLPELYGHLGDG